MKINILSVSSIIQVHCIGTIKTGFLVTTQRNSSSSKEHQKFSSHHGCYLKCLVSSSHRLRFACWSGGTYLSLVALLQFQLGKSLTSSSHLDFGSLLSPVHIKACHFLYHHSLAVENWQVLWVTWSLLNLLFFLAILVCTHTSLFHYLKDSTREMSLSEELGFVFFSILVRMLASTVLSRCFVIA
jgi:hypothetical protein